MKEVLSEKEAEIKKKFLRDINNDVRSIRASFGYDRKSYWDKDSLIEAYCEYFHGYEYEKEKVLKNFSGELRKELLEIVDIHQAEVLSSVKSYFMKYGNINDYVTKNHKPKTFFSFLFD